MRIVGISDIHGNLVNIPKCDVLCICGDIIGLNDQRSMDASKHWFENRFANWINKLPCEKVFAVPGNHDFYIESCYTNSNKLNEQLLKDIELKTNNKLKFLIDEHVIYKDTKFYGTPWINPIGGKPFWAFDPNKYLLDNLLEEKFSKIPKDTDILLSHDNPYMNETLEIYSKVAKYHLYGHWHDGIANENKNRYNCSLLNDNYWLKYKPKVIDIMSNEEKIKQNIMMTLIQIVDQLKTCGFTCEAGKLEDNIAFQELEKLVTELSENAELEEDQISWDNVITGEVIEEDPTTEDNTNVEDIIND